MLFKCYFLPTPSSCKILKVSFKSATVVLNFWPRGSDDAVWVCGPAQTLDTWIGSWDTVLPPPIGTGPCTAPAISQDQALGLCATAVQLPCTGIGSYTALHAQFSMQGHGPWSSPHPVGHMTLHSG